MAFQQATRKEVFGHKDLDGKTVALTITFAVWDTVYAPLSGGDATARIFEVFITPEKYADAMLQGTAALKRQAIITYAKADLTVQYKDWVEGLRRNPARIADAGASTLLGTTPITTL